MNWSRPDPAIQRAIIQHVPAMLVARTLRAPRRLLFVFALASTAFAQTPDPWQSAIRNVVRAVQLRAESPSAISLVVNNISSLPSAKADEVKSQLHSAFFNAGIELVKPERALADVTVTISENVSGYLLVSEISHSSRRDVAIFAVPREREYVAPRMANAITLRKTLLWSQSGPEPVLDVALFKDTGLLVLDGSTISLYQNQNSRWQLVQSQPIAHDHPWPRDLRGRLLMLGDKKFEAYLPGKKCSGSADSSLALTCLTSDDPWPLGSGQTKARGFFGARNFFTGALAGVPSTTSVAPFFSAAPVPGQDSSILFASTDGTVRHLSGRAAGLLAGSDIAAIKSDCGAGWQLLFDGPGDRTQPDVIHAADFSSGSPVLVGAPLDFDSPVTALWSSSGGDSAVAITGSYSSGVNGFYEAYAISVACH